MQDPSLLRSGWYVPIHFCPVKMFVLSPDPGSDPPQSPKIATFFVNVFWCPAKSVLRRGVEMMTFDVAFRPSLPSSVSIAKGEPEKNMFDVKWMYALSIVLLPFFTVVKNGRRSQLLYGPWLFNTNIIYKVSRLLIER
jgi:hypothetical protein